MGGLFDVLTDHFDQFAGGLWVTVRLVAGSFAIALVVGTVVAALRIAPSRWLQRLGGIYVETFRNIPLLVLLLISFAGLRRAGVDISNWTAGILSLGLYTAAYVAEALRSGVFAVGRGQVDAGLSLGLQPGRDAAADRAAAGLPDRDPAASSITIAMIKNSAIVGVSLLALPDLLKEARIVQSRTFATDEAFFWAAVGYLLLTGTATLVFRSLERRYAIHR